MDGLVFLPWTIRTKRQYMRVLDAALKATSPGADADDADRAIQRQRAVFHAAMSIRDTDKCSERFKAYQPDSADDDGFDAAVFDAVIDAVVQHMQLKN